ncbi:hypothetical protein XH94_38105 [Bradyrhizobium zhanjiangense]|uniref:Uncharacterized protein n=2 Tax=Bradyrhizobium zhanjiangense TaxID=1325107 RepID=A0A4Q0RR60_9BRAD|nr:hypothetical protein XH94_38105 [Bradyrhizobium zhanjiangense]
MSSPEISTQSTAAADRDPLFVVIERHRELSAHYDAALSVSAKLDGGPEFDAADEISSQRNHALAEHAKVLIRSKPTTIPGVVAFSRYVASLRAWQLSDEEDWHQVFLTVLADAVDEISVARPPAS